MNSNKTMYSVWLESQIHSRAGQAIGQIMALSDPEIIMAGSDEEAMEKAAEKAEVAEYIKSLNFCRGRSSRRLLVRVKSVVRSDTGHVIYKCQNISKRFK